MIFKIESDKFIAKHFKFGTLRDLLKSVTISCPRTRLL